MKRLPQVVVTDYIVEPNVEQEVLGGAVDLVCLGARNTQEVRGRLGEADVIICFHDVEVTAELLQEAPRCVGVVRGGVGYNNIDFRAAGELGIMVCNVPDYGTEEVADHALALLLAIARRIVPAVDSIRRGEWNVEIYQGTPRLRGQTLGLIGAGPIGSALALRAKVLGMRVTIFDPYLPRGFEKSLGVDRVWNLKDLLSQSQFLSLHCPLTDDTRHILNAKTIELLPRGAYLINTARGGLIDEEALLRALDRGHLAFAALDVVQREPLQDERLQKHPRLIITPHCAFYSVEAAPELRRKAAEEAGRLARREVPRNPVNMQFIKNPRVSRDLK